MPARIPLDRLPGPRDVSLYTKRDCMRTLPKTFYDRDAEAVARALLGKRLVRRVAGEARVGRIVETEAYLGPPDLAAHSSKGRTPRTEVMYGPPGHAYVYLIYGMHHCLNVVTGPGAIASAVLIRALEPVAHLTAAANGPGRLCRALDIDRRLNGHDLTRGELRIEGPADDPEELEVVARPRIGVDYAGEWALRPLRFYIAGNRWISRP
jgi:DNA-3-methyladenine glycosylase